MDVLGGRNSTAEAGGYCRSVCGWVTLQRGRAVKDRGDGAWLVREGSRMLGAGGGLLGRGCRGRRCLRPVQQAEGGS